MATETVQIVINAKDNASKALGGISGALGGIASVAGGILSAQLLMNLGRGFLQLGKDAIMGASDLNETANKISAIFSEEWAGDLTDWADDWGASLGQSKQQMLDAAATFGVFGKAAGLTDQSLVDFSSNFTELASDLASFYNTSPEDAITAIGAALRGESEPIRRYGVLLNDAALRQKALELGIVKTTKEALTPQQRVLAAEALIYEQTADAQGDFIRTSDGLANSQRILSATFENIKTQLGGGLLPLVTQVTGAFKDWLSSPEVQTGLDNLVKFIGEAGVKLGEFFGWLTGGGGAAALQGMVDQLSAFIAPLTSAIVESLPLIKETFMGMWQSMVDIYNQFAPVIVENVKGFIDQLAFFWREHGATILQIISFAWDLILVVIGGALALITGIITAAMALINGVLQAAEAAMTGDLQMAGQILLETTQNIWDGIKNTLLTILESALALAGTNLEDFVATWSANWEMLKLIVTTVVENILEFINNKWQDFREAGLRMLDGLVSGVAAATQRLIDAVVGAVRRAIAAAKAALEERSPSKVFAEIGMNMMLGMAEGVSNTANVPMAATAAATQAITTNTYNLTINEAGQRGNVVRDFGLMQSLAGA